MYRTHVLTFAAAMLMSTAPFAQHGPPANMASLARGADRIVVATITKIDPVLQKNEHGDELIVSRAHLHVEAVLKGKGRGAGEALVVEIEGGTLGDVTLDVSDLPRMERGERAVLFLSQTARGAHVPHGRGAGIMKLDPADRVTGTGLTLAEVRAAVERAR